jgi:hypothetical protein
MPLPSLGLAEFAKRTDDLMKGDLLYWRDLWFFWATLSTAAVVAGLFGELPELWHEIKSVTERYKVRGNTATLNEREAAEWIQPVAFLGWFLIVLGVAGELAFGMVVSSAEGMLRDFTARQLIAARAETDAVRLIASLNEWQAAQLNAKAAELTKEAETERLARVKIEASVVWRSLSRTDEQQIARKLKPFSSTVAWVTYHGDDIEASSFAVDIDSVLAMAGWQVSAPMQLGAIETWPTSSKAFKPTSGPRLPTGVQINTSKASKPAATILARELTSRGLDAVIEELSSEASKGEFIDITVWHRPSGPQGEAKLRIRGNETNRTIGNNP